MNIRAHVVLAPVLFHYSASGLAQEAVTTYEPANFPADHSSIISRIEFPDYQTNVVVRVMCDVTVNQSGEFGVSVCRSDHDDKVLFIKAVETNIDITRINPARVNGTEVEVYFQYTVEFEKRDDTRTVKLFPHQFVGIEGPGDDYIGPQRYRTGIVGSSLLTKCTGSYLMWYGMVVPAEGGKPMDIKALKRTGNSKCKRFIQQVVEAGVYIPAFLRGVPVKAPYLEIWADRAWR